jgi:hypothetical protein
MVALVRRELADVPPPVLPLSRLLQGGHEGAALVMMAADRKAVLSKVEVKSALVDVLRPSDVRARLKCSVVPSLECALH